MATTVAPPITLEQFSRLPKDGNRHEVSEGDLHTMPPVKLAHTLVAETLHELLQAHLKQHRQARALMEASYVLSSDPLTVRQPDVSVLSNDRIWATPADSYCHGAPELAIEIVSASDFAEDLELKAAQYLNAGGIEVWIVYPKTKTVHVLTEGAARILQQEEKLESQEMLPGFSVKVSELFL